MPLPHTAVIPPVASFFHPPIFSFLLPFVLLTSFLLLSYFFLFTCCKNEVFLKIMHGCFYVQGYSGNG